MEMKIRDKYRCPHNKLFITALTLLIAFLAAELMFRMFDLYRIFPPVDIISHMLSGMTLAVVIYWVLSLTKVKRKVLTAIIYTFFAAIIWEILETLEEMVIPNPPYLSDYLIWDGVFDITVTVVAVIMALDLLYVLNKKKWI